MTNDRQHQITELYHAALGRDGRQRAEFLREACAGDGALRREVESLLGYEDGAAPFLERPAIEEAARMIDHAREGSESAMREGGTGDLAGRRIGVYQIETRIGAGGMGEVYRARDTKLGRDVAIKVLPPHLVADPERRTRFEREARMLATLNHPHIAHIYGFEESSGISALVMELVPGETLDEIIAGGRHSADRTSRPVLPLDQALQIARHIADALEAAHERGIVHRDLKPANVKVTSDGTVKVLDFGLAKAMIGDASGPDLSQLPTITSDGTRDGIILGTPAYMSPEQARGKPVDKRADIWAFGGVLYEMLTGRPAFEGETVSDTIAAILEREPDWNALPSSTPARLRGLIGDCLTRDPKQRLRDIGDARIAINRLIGGAPDDVATPTALPINAAPRWQRALPWAAAVIATAVAGAVLALLAPWRTPLPLDALWISGDLGADVSLFNTRLGSTVALSPDGKLLVFTGQKTAGGLSQLYVRGLNQLQARPLSGTDGASDPVFSPDGQWIAFRTAGNLKKISVAGGGAAIPVLDDVNLRGAWWSEDGTFIFEPNSINGVSLRRVKDEGGETEPVGALADGEVTQRWPQALPGGKGVLFTASSEGSDFNDAYLVVQPPTGPRQVVVHGGYYGRYVPSGHLIYIHDTTLFAVPFDLAGLTVTGHAVPVLDGIVASPADGSAQFAFSASGTLAYVPGTFVTTARALAWMGRSEKTTPLGVPAADWSHPRFSPDGRKLALQIWDGRQSDVRIYDLGRQTPLQLTVDTSSNDGWPVWTPGGQGIVFKSRRTGVDGLLHFYLYWRRADGTGEVQQLATDLNMVPQSWHPSENFLAVTNPQKSIMILPMEGDEINGWKAGKPEVFQETTARDASAMFSPKDGRWIAYTASDNEVYVRPFRGPGGPWKISSGGGSLPTWSPAPERPELFFGTSTGTIMVVTYSVVGNSFRPDKPRPWSPAKYQPAEFRRFDLYPDGLRFVVEPVGEQPQERHDKVVFIFNFFDELRRIAPVAKR